MSLFEPNGKGLPTKLIVETRKKPSTVDSAQVQQRRVQSSDAPPSGTQTVSIRRQKNGEIARRSTRNTELSLSSVQLGSRSEVRKDIRSLEFDTAGDQQDSRAKQEDPRIPRKRPASPSLSPGRKRRAIGSTNVQSNLEIVPSEPDNGLTGRTSRLWPSIALPSIDWEQQSNFTPSPSPGPCLVFPDSASTVRQSGCGASYECKSPSCLTCGPDSKPGREVADELEKNPEYTLQISLSSEIIRHEKEPSQSIDVNAQCVQENSSNLPELDRDLLNHSNVVVSMQEPSVFNDGEVFESLRNQGRQGAYMSQIEIPNEARMDTKIEYVQDLFPLVTEDITPWTVIPEQDSQLSALVDIKAKLASTLPPLQLPLDPLPQIMNKVPLPEFPPIWAQVSTRVYPKQLAESDTDHQSRQEVCESFDWFRSYQGGVYHVNEMARGYLLSGFPSRYVVQTLRLAAPGDCSLLYFYSRDRFEHGGKLIISHGYIF